MKDISRLALDRIRELGQVAMTALHEMEKWREPALKDFERTKMQVTHNNALQEQCKWIKAIEENEEEAP